MPGTAMSPPSTTWQPNWPGLFDGAEEWPPPAGFSLRLCKMKIQMTQLKKEENDLEMIYSYSRVTVVSSRDSVLFLVMSCSSCNFIASISK